METERLHAHLPRGHGGVATLWCDQLDPYATRLKEGNNRIVVTAFRVNPQPILVMNCYLPSGNSPKAQERFEEDVDLMGEVINKFYSTFDILIIGDLNADFYHRKLRKERQLLEFIQEHGMVDLGASTSNRMSYINNNLNHKSRVDHALVKSTQSGNWSPVQLEEHKSWNTSTHTSLMLTVHTPGKPVCPVKKKSTSHTTYKWKDADPGTFAATVEEELDIYKLDLLDVAGAFEVFQGVVSTATAAAVPAVTRKIGSQRKKQPPWTDELKSAVGNSKKIYHQWKMAGGPKEHHLWEAVKKSGKTVRRVLRVQAAVQRRSLLHEISEASVWDAKLFHKLVRRQRAVTNSGGGLLVGGRLVTEENEILNAWAEYYEDLSTPRNPSTQEEEELLANLRILSRMDTEQVVVTPELIAEAIKKLKTNKAPDRHSMNAEQMKLLPSAAVQCLAKLFTRIFKEGRVPEILKLAFKLPIPKKGKDAKLQDNHRGITIAPILGKVLEIICLREGIAPEIPTSDLQFGFTGGRAPCMASLIITEAIADARSSRSPLYIASLDAKKAFDVVDHHILKVKLFGTSIKRRIWEIVDDLYVGGEEAVRLNGAFSRTYTVKQGVKQGGILSPVLYKMYVSNLLNSLQEADMGLSIGSIFLGTPACADDVLLASKSPWELQGMMQVNADYANVHRYEIHANPDPDISKSSVTSMRLPEAHKMLSNEWKLHDATLPETKKFTHLGLTWEQGKQTPNIEEKIRKARQTAYSLLGAGLHGRSGLDPLTSFRLIQLYVVPTLLYGLEAAILRKGDTNKLELFYKGILRQVQSLPTSTASEAVYLLLGAVPIEATLHLRILSLLGGVARLEASNPLRRLAIRQLSLGRSGWFQYAGDIASRYGIDIHIVLEATWPKDAWKAFCKTSVLTYWRSYLTVEAMKKSTLHSLLLDTKMTGPHTAWSECRGSPHLIEATAQRVRMLVGRAQLKGSKWREKSNQDLACPLCGHHMEDTAHFLLHCPRLTHIRTNRLISYLQLWRAEGLPPPESPGEMTQAILNGDRYIPTYSAETLRLKRKTVEGHRICSALCYKLYRERDILINDDLMSKV